MRLWFKGNVFRAVADTAGAGPYALVEEYVGTAPDRLTYPNVSTCTTVTVLLENDTLVGTHLSAMCTAADIGTIVAKLIELAGGGRPVRIVLAGVLRYIAGQNQRGGVAYTSTPEYTWPAKLETFAGAFGVPRANVQYFDQGMGTEKHYQLRAIGAGQLVAFYQDVGSRVAGSGTASKPFSASDPWSPLTLLDFPII